MTENGERGEEERRELSRGRERRVNQDELRKSRHVVVVVEEEKAERGGGGGPRRERGQENSVAIIGVIRC
ncbi:hypothetical protein, partial [Klebsiella variicola]|uniref:hypothetical protein n=1 Tax=Klebsiella variicola TaxID=244366 RepID=UPI002731778C